jgi:hypothetical protein
MEPTLLPELESAAPIQPIVISGTTATRGKG